MTVATAETVLTRVDATCAEVIAALHHACFEQPWDAAAMAELLAMPGAFGVLALDARGGGEAPVGFALARAAGGEAEILSLAVLPAARRRHIAQALLDAVIADARSAGADALFLEVAEGNVAARRLYERAGFKTVGRRPDYYAGGQEGGAACIMRCTLD